MHTITIKSIAITSIAAGALLLLAGGASAADCLPQVRDGWIRLSPPGMSMSMPMTMLAGYGRIENPCAQAATITGGKSAAFADVSVHRTSIVDGISRMRAVPSLPIAAHGAATLAPGGLHLMLMQPTTAFKPGAHVPIVLTLQDGREITAEFVAR